MSNYIFSCHYGKCSLADEKTGIVINWTQGKFDTTKDWHFEGFILNNSEDFLNEKINEMCEYIKEEYDDYL